MFRTGPIKRDLAGGHGLAGVEQFADLSVDLEIGRNGGDRFAEISEFFCGYGGGNLFQQIGAADGRVKFWLEFGDGLTGFPEGFLRHGVDTRADLLDFLFRDDPGIEELAGEETANRRMGVDFGVEGGLGEVRLVALVVSVPAIANDIENDVLVEFLAEFEGELDDVSGGQGVVAIDVKDREAEGFSGSGTIASGAGVGSEGGEGNLVIDDNVDGATRAVALEAGEIEGFGHDALADESAVAVNQDGEDLFAFDRVIAVALASPGHAFHDRIYRLEVAWVGGEGKADFLSGGGGDIVFVAEVVFDVSIAENGFRHVVLVKFGEELPAGFAEGVHEDVETAAVGHADDDLLHAGGGTGFEQRIEGGDQCFASLQGKSFLTDVAGVKESLERFGGDDFFQDAALLGRGEGRLVAGALHAVAQPAADGEVHDVHELDPDMVAVGLFEVGQDVAERSGTAAAERAGVKNGIEVSFAEAEGGERKVGIFFGGQAKGVEVGEGVAEGPVGKEEVIDTSLRKNVAEFWGGTAVGGSGAGAGGGSELATEFKTFKESAPSGIDRRSVRFPGLVEFLEKGRVAGVAETTEGWGRSRGGAVRVQPRQGLQGRILIRGGF